jgi:hypothetical protein
VIAAAVAPVLTLLWLWRLDLVADARVAVLDFNRFYVSQGLTFKVTPSISQRRSGCV